MPTVTLNHIDSYCGQHVYEMTVLVDDVLAGHMNVSVYEDVPYVTWIEVSKEFRGRGVAGMMLARLQREYPESVIDLGMLTEDGAAMYGRIRFEERPNPVYEAAAAAVPELARLLSRCEDAAERLARGEEDETQALRVLIDRWNDYSDAHEEAREVLEREPPVLRFVRTDLSTDIKPPQASTVMNP